MYKNVVIMLVLIQPKWRGKGRRPLSKNYFKQTSWCLDTLCRTGFPPKNIMLITPHEDYSEKMVSKYGITTRLGPKIPHEFKRVIKRNSDAYWFYKPIALYHAVPEPLSDSTVMSFCDVDALFKKNPMDMLLNQKVDIWSCRGTTLPDRRRVNPPKRYRNPRMNMKDLTEFYHNHGGSIMADLHLQYKYKLPKELLYSAWTCILPHVYKDVIKTWYEMCTTSLDRLGPWKGKPGDQEFFSAAGWHLGLSQERAAKGIKTVCTQYGGHGKKSEMKKNYKLYCEIADRRRKRREKKEQDSE